MAKKYVVIREKEDELEHGNDKHLPAGYPGGKGGQFAKKEEWEKASAEIDPEKALAEDMARKKKENEYADIINKWNENKNAGRKAAQDRVKSLADNGQKVTANLANLLQERRGSRRINPKETDLTTKRPYAEISDDELNKRVRRMQLERQYGDLSGDTKYVMTGKEKTREFLQTLGTLTAIAGSIVGIILAIKKKTN